MFNQVLSGKKLVILAVMLVLLSAFGLEIYSKNPKWNFDNIPEKWKFELEVSNPNFNKEKVDISGFFWTKNVLEKLLDDNWENINNTFRKNFQKVNKRYGSGDYTLYLSIDQTSDKSFPFELNKLAFTQGPNQYGGEHFGMKAMNSTLEIATSANIYRVHSLRPGVRAKGIIYLPNGIDLSKSFFIWYGDYSAELNAEGLDIEERSD